MHVAEKACDRQTRISGQFEDGLFPFYRSRLSSNTRMILQCKLDKCQQTSNAINEVNFEEEKNTRQLIDYD